MAWREKDNLTEMKLDRAIAKEAAKAVRSAFIWAATREGGDYWYRVAKRLEAFAEAKPEGAAKPSGANT